jgi:hypothetical protein
MSVTRFLLAYATLVFVLCGCTATRHDDVWESGINVKPTATYAGIES